MPQNMHIDNTKQAIIKNLKNALDKLKLLCYNIVTFIHQRKRIHVGAIRSVYALFLSENQPYMQAYNLSADVPRL